MRQGDVFRSIAAIPVLVAQGTSEDRPTPHGVVVVSQTCDAVRVNASTVVVAPVVRLIGPDVSLARSGRSPRYAALPALGPDFFAQLETVATVSKHLLRREDRRRGVTGLLDERRLAQSVGRRFARFAFPDDLGTCQGG